MSPHSLWSAAFVSTLAGQAAIVGCSSSSPASPAAGEDAAGGAEGGGTDAGSLTDAGSGAEAPVQSCEASVLPPPDAGGACNACLKTSCTAELAACASDCTCGPIVACLEVTNLNNYPGCNGLGAIESGEVALMSFAACAANPSKCGGPCFSQDAGGD
jgi:hypothetical protein